jgi:hypothetical protein
MTSIGAGNVELTLDGQTVTLRPTLRAAQTLSKQSGGLMSAVQAVARLELEVITSVIAMGLNITTPREINDLAEKVWSTGVVDLVEPVTKYLTILANGGRSVEAIGGSGEGNPQGS